MLFKTEGVDVVKGKFSSMQDGYRVTLDIDADLGIIRFRGRGRDDEDWLVVGGSKLSTAGMEKIAEAASYLICSACLAWFTQALAALEAEKDRQTEAGYSRMANGGV